MRTFSALSAIALVALVGGGDAFMVTTRTSSRATKVSLYTPHVDLGSQCSVGHAQWMDR